MGEYLFNANIKDTAAFIINFERVFQPLYNFQLLSVFAKRFMMFDSVLNTLLPASTTVRLGPLQTSQMEDFPHFFILDV